MSKPNTYCKKFCKGFQESGQRCLVDDCDSPDRYEELAKELIDSAVEVHCEICPSYQYCETKECRDTETMRQILSEHI